LLYPSTEEEEEVEEEEDEEETKGTPRVSARAVLFSPTSDLRA
jgi:hypothetical protein